MAVFKVIIDGFGELPVTPPFTPRVEFGKRPNGEVQVERDIWSFRAVLPVSLASPVDPTGLKAQREALLAIFRKRTAFVRVTLDGSTFEEISTATHPRGAFFRNFDVQETGGEWVSLLLVTFEVVGEKSVEIPGVFDATKTITDTVERGRTSVNISVEARGPGALAFVRGEAPSGVTRSVISQVIQEDRVRGSFDVDGSEDESQFTIDEEVEVTPGLFEQTYFRPTRSDRPREFFGSRLPTIIRISGTLEAKVGTAIVPPVSETLARHAVPNGMRITRSVNRRAGQQETPVESVRYDMTFEVPFEVTIEQVLAERRALSRTVFVRSEGSNSGFDGIEIPGGAGIRNSGALPALPGA